MGEDRAGGAEGRLPSKLASMIQYVDLETAKTSRGVRMVVSGAVPSPWGEAAKALFRLAGVSVVATRSQRGDAALAAWTQSHNVPVVFHDDEPPRSVWSQIVALAARLAGPGVLLPTELEARAQTIGLVHELAGEDGLGWNARMLMIHASFTSDGQRGFPKPVAAYLAGKYGYAPDRVEPGRARALATLAMLARRLGDGDYFAEGRPGVLDAYVATFLTPVTPISEADCPAMPAPLRAAFAVAAEDLGPHVDARLLGHRRRMFEQHLGWPIEL